MEIVIPVLLFLSGGFSLVLAVYAQNKRLSTLIHIFSLFSIAVFIYAFGYGFEFLSQTLEDMLFWSKIQYLGIYFLPGLVLLFSISVLVYAFGIFKFSLFNLLPMARDTVFEGMRDAILVVDTELRLVDYNKRCQALLPEIHKKNIGKNIKKILAGHPDILKIFTMVQTKAIVIPFMENKTLLFFQLSLLPLFDRKKREIGCFITFNDITRQIKFMQELKKMATIDELTGIHNRRNLMVQAEIEMSRSRRTGKPISLILLDMDNFKGINDTWGHHCGDLVLKAFARAVKHNIREIDIFGRYGGDEFIIILPETDKPIALETANRLCRLVADLIINFQGQTIRLTASIGVSSTRDMENPSVEALVKYADKALYIAKNKGSNRVAHN